MAKGRVLGLGPGPAAPGRTGRVSTIEPRGFSRLPSEVVPWSPHANASSGEGRPPGDSGRSNSHGSSRLHESPHARLRQLRQDEGDACAAQLLRTAPIEAPSIEPRVPAEFATIADRAFQVDCRGGRRDRRAGRPAGCGRCRRPRSPAASARRSRRAATRRSRRRRPRPSSSRPDRLRRPRRAGLVCAVGPWMLEAAAARARIAALGERHHRAAEDGECGDGSEEDSRGQVVVSSLHRAGSERDANENGGTRNRPRVADRSCSKHGVRSSSSPAGSFPRMRRQRQQRPERIGASRESPQESRGLSDARRDERLDRSADTSPDGGEHPRTGRVTRLALASLGGRSIGQDGRDGHDGHEPRSAACAAGGWREAGRSLGGRLV